jgi:hypothetical protein
MATPCELTARSLLEAFVMPADTLKVRLLRFTFGAGNRLAGWFYQAIQPPSMVMHSYSLAFLNMQVERG